MLGVLKIENVALISAAELSFGAGFNALTGETGAGKSIMIDALGAVLGERASKDLVRTGTQKARISAVFNAQSAAVAKWLSERLQLEETELLIQREIFANGRSVCRICGMPVTVTLLRELGRMLVHVHGQHDNQALLDESTHLYMLDSYAALDSERTDCRELYSIWRGLCAGRDKLLLDEGEKARRIDILKYQINEIEEASLSDGEQETLSKRRKLLQSAERFSTALNEAYEALYGGENGGGACALLEYASRTLDSAGMADGETEALATRARDLYYEAADLSSELRAYGDRLESFPGELDEVENRLGLIQTVLKKYGGSEKAVLGYLSQAKEELDGIERAGERLAALSAEIDKAYAVLETAAIKLSEKRKTAAIELGRRLSEELLALDMLKARFHVEIGSESISASGIDSVRFMFTANAGEPLKALSKIASGGELARVMLALSGILSDEVETLVFDEIDTGVSGRAAQKVAEKLSALSARRQVLCVTHLPQIAARADTHFGIRKETSEGRAVTSVEELDKDARTTEIARIIGGASITETTLKAAAEMVELKAIKERRE